MNTQHRLILNVLLVTVLALAGFASALATPQADVDFVGLDTFVQREMQAASIPGLAYGIVQDGRVVHMAAFGVANLEDGRPMTPQTPMLINSVGKIITALAIRQLINAGKIALDAPVQRYLPWFALATPDAAEQITIRQLLEHTSGLSRGDGQNPAHYRAGLTAEEVVRSLASVKIDRPVGASWEYSNLNYIIAGVVIEAVSGQSYAEYVQRAIFDPLEMHHSYVSLEAAQEGGLSDGYRYLFGFPVRHTEPFPSAILPAGGHISTAEDMTHFLAALANHGRYGDISIVTLDGRSVPDINYGLDWEAIASRDPNMGLGQSGASVHYQADLLVLPNRHFGVVVLGNTNPTELMNLARGADSIAIAIMRRYHDWGPTPTRPSLRTVYLALDGILVLLVAAFLAHMLGLRTWRARLRHARNRPRFIAGSIIADAVLPLLVLVGLPLTVGLTGSAPRFDLAASWGFLTWTMPDIAYTLLALALGLLVVAAVKLAWWRTR